MSPRHFAAPAASYAGGNQRQRTLAPGNEGGWFQCEGETMSSSDDHYKSPRPPGSREEDAWLSDEQLARCAPAEIEPFQSPVPTRMVSNGEYMPHPQTKKQKHVEHRVKELADMVSKKVGISRRQFLGGSGGMAAAFMAMNDVYGKEFFKVHEEEMFEPAACRENGPPDDLFVFDDQTHIVRNTLEQGRGLRALAQGPGKASTCSSPFKTSKPARCGRTSTATPFRTSSGARAQRQLHQGAEAVRPDGRTAQQRAPWLDPHADLTLRQEPGFFVEPGSPNPPGRVATSRGARAPQARFKIACVVPQAAARAPTRCFLTARSAAA